MVEPTSLCMASFTLRFLSLDIVHCAGRKPGITSKIPQAASGEVSSIFFLLAQAIILVAYNLVLQFNIISFWYQDVKYT